MRGRVFAEGAQGMKNPRFHSLLRQCWWEEERLNVTRLAEGLMTNRAHLSDVLNNKPGRGHQVRKKVVTFLQKHAPEMAPQILVELGWDSAGKIVPRPTKLHVEQSD